ncbi:hypothetical protein SAMN05443287_107281 [Micromonospora phaseoli]|uniref:Exo-alpha-sialidase n=1 Tax=Micromonospora phaseoli TaxID=1144548 RepID=A0A1H7BL28_9ACTN|nr:hypothetical protein [Micromonospora phaseoli]PZV94947.1 hypothetical protein CLV64_10882 [Micromonospora phaseoli]GIJ79909.1 hypothetical protein Xph01_43410 [Micromonospora phaseoli]SEJ77057.1 hypothetical protein SAMN05443287_107281 [Micromonospora phaseoli]
MTTRRACSLILPALLAVLSGCAIGDVRRTPPGPSNSASPISPPPSPRPVAETRTTRLAVPKKYDRPYVEFADVRNGYALFAVCDGLPPGPECPALLWSTRDGGLSWQQLRHPKPVADNQQLYTAAGMLALVAEPHGWWTSTDGGETFDHSPGLAAPPRWWAAEGRFRVIDHSGTVGRWDGTMLRPLRTQPSIPALNTVVQGDGRTVTAGGTEYRGPVVAAGAGEDGRLYAAISWDEGRSWERTPVPTPDGEVGVLRAELAGGQLWLIGERPDRTSFPALWRLEASGWQPVSAQGHPESGQAVPLGGLVAIVSPQGAGVVAGGWYMDLPWPVTSEHHLRLLPDDTLFAVSEEEILLGVGNLADRTWTAVIIETI